MDNMRTTAIIIPCYNEEKRLKIKEFLRYLKKYSWLNFIFVDDASTDKTMDHIMILKDRFADRVHCINLEVNSGKANAVWQGFKKAFQIGFENIGYWDADLSTPLSTIEKMCKELLKPDIVMVFGSRVRLLNRHIERKTIRHYLGRLFATAASLVLGLPIYDTQCGAKIFKNNNELRRIFNKPFITSWIFDVEIFSRFILLNKYYSTKSLAEIAIELPLQEWYDVAGSKLNFLDFLIAAYELFKISIILHRPPNFPYDEEC